MSFAIALAAAVEAASYQQLSELSRKVWSAWSSGALDDATAQALAEQLQAKRGGLSGKGPPPQNAPAGFSVARARLPQRSPSRIRSIERRRRLAASGAVPSALAEGFTQGMVAALAVIAGEIRRHGSCTLPLDCIAAIAGISRTLVKQAIRRAVALRMLGREERRRARGPSLTNILRGLGLWLAWLRRKIAGRLVPTTTAGSQERESNRRERRAWSAIERRSRRESG